jgi:hypothetical protein
MKRGVQEGERVTHELHEAHENDPSFVYFVHFVVLTFCLPSLRSLRVLCVSALKGFFSSAHSAVKILCNGPPQFLL